MHRLLSAWKFVYILPLIVALIYIALLENTQFNNYPVLLFLAALVSIGLYKFDRIKNRKALNNEAILRMEGEINWLRGVLEGLPLGVVVFDTSSKIVYINNGFENITGYGKELLGLEYKALEEKLFPLPERRNLDIEKAIKNCQQMNEHRRSLISKDGRVITVKAKILPLKSSKGALTGTLCLFCETASYLELQNLRQKTHFFLDFTSSCVLAVDNRLRVTIFNAASEKLTGLKKEDVLGRHVTEIFNDYEAENYPIIKTIITGETFHNYEVTLFVNGQMRTLLFDTALITDDGGKVNGAIGIFKDISESKRIEEELKRTVFAYSKEKSFMRNVLNNLPLAIITYDRDLMPTFMNKMAEDLTGYRFEEFASSMQNISANEPVFPSSDFSRHLAEAVLSSGEPIFGEQRTITSRDGTAIPVSLDIHPIYSALREKNGVMIIARDIREIREHEHLLYLSKCILNSLNSAVISIDANYRIIIFNPFAERLFGISADHVIGKNINEVHLPFLKEERMLQNTLEIGTGFQFTEAAIQVKGEEITLFN
ncbi:MAG: PAS domain S-box protein [Pelotomaculum sp.]|nr:PAS domain S-box protein [Pelotomaculum sp.]